MTLDEAILHSEEVAERLENSCKRDWMGEDDGRCAAEHRQLAEWLRDYKRLKEQEPIIDNIRAEIMSKDGLEEALEIIDKYKVERGKNNSIEVKEVLDKIRAQIKHFMFEVNPSSSESDYACNYILDVIDKYKEES